NQAKVLMFQLGPGNTANRNALEHLHKAETRVRDPKIPSGVLGDRKHHCAGKVLYENKPVILQVANSAPRRSPDASAVILKESLHRLIGQSATRNLTHIDQ